MNRATAIAEFLTRHGYGHVRAAPLAQDASSRRYLRLTGGPRPAVLMDAPAPENIRPFVRIAAHLAGVGVSVPDILAADPEAGLVLEEDLGDALFPTLFPGPELADAFAAAVDVLALVQRAEPPPDLPPWDAASMAQTALGTFLDWWWPSVLGSEPPQRARDDFGRALTAMLAPMASGPRGFVHRDFFAGNLVWLPQREGFRRVGILDFQTGALGHPAYDLVSLLQDARHEIPAEIQTRATERFLAARPELERSSFENAFAACAAQRHLRVACQWVRLARRDARPQYLVHGPRTWRLLHQALQHPIAGPLAAALDRWVPPALRGNPAIVAS